MSQAKVHKSARACSAPGLQGSSYHYQLNQRAKAVKSSKNKCGNSCKLFSCYPHDTRKKYLRRWKISYSPKWARLTEEFRRPPWRPVKTWTGVFDGSFFLATFCASFSRVASLTFTGATESVADEPKAKRWMMRLSIFLSERTIYIQNTVTCKIAFYKQDILSKISRFIAFIK